MTDIFARHLARALLLAMMAAAVAGCAGGRLPAWAEHVFPLRSTPPDSPEQREVATYNEAASYLAYQAERHRVLNGNERKTPRIRLVSIADTAAMRKAVRALVPIGSDIAEAKLALELNGFTCAWEGWRKKGLRCDVAKELPPAPARWDIKIASRRTLVSHISVALIDSAGADTYTR